ncbi:hypothetical protein GMORB2_0394 [Geosmithia morbida]|uniref:BZIP domain-containing protein n=1 Tax=Geosmithia morbida TaxID=1094350 RepID=A0A9P4Z3N8_9HYPO|nr:uncharacterized protein GMORB2_0394 [Geosmithia morbida]KAF4126658.1 hypothetical protein GMORB2_0394 [Geosmithia morbida]
MPRKTKTAASVAENREAQRRSRARRRDLIADLRRRLEEYERIGVASAIEMQRAAQAVNIQNQRLKSLLGVYGVPEDEIEQYLSSGEEGCVELNRRRECTTCGRLLPRITQTMTVPMEGRPQSSYRSAPSTARDAVPTLGSGLLTLAKPTPIRKQSPYAESPFRSTAMSRKEHEETCVLPEEAQRLHRRSHAANGLGSTTKGNTPVPIDVLSALSDSLVSSSSVTDDGDHSESLRTSCDKAAKILVELHNYVDPSRARSALGCHGDSSCSVKNTKIFELMDHLE